MKTELIPLEEITGNPWQTRAGIEENLAKAGLKNPWSEIETPAQQAWHKALRVSGWMENLEKVLPKEEAVRGNIDNLYGLLGAQGMEEEQYSLIKIMIGLLEQVIVELGDMDDKAIEHVSWLLHTPPGDINFKGHLDQANAATLRYTLALTPDGSGQMTRVVALEQRLRKITNKTLVEVFQEEEA